MIPKTSSTASELPILITEIEFTTLNGEIKIDTTDYKSVRALVRKHGFPAGYAVLPASPMHVSQLKAEILSQLGDGLAGIDGELEMLNREIEVVLPFISVVLCTRDRPEGARRTLESLVAMDYPDFEIVVVDNAPSDDRTQMLIEEQFASDNRIRYVRELQPGLSCARNRGLFEASANLVAFTDDDVNVDAGWLRGIDRGFSRTDNVGCVTGLVPTAELETASQLYFDQRYSWGTVLRTKVFDLDDTEGMSALYPYSAGIFGTGANFAIDRTVLEGVATFDESLGAGTATGGGEDLDIFVRVILAGHRLVFEPSAIVTHVHRADAHELNKQLFNYGSGLAAFLIKQFLDPSNTFELIKRIPMGLLKLNRVRQLSDHSNLLPRSVTRQEFYGMVAGPYRYVKAKRRAQAFSNDSRRPKTITPPAQEAVSSALRLSA